MLTVKSAKSKLERAEGMNHLWIRYGPVAGAADARIRFELPEGIYRRKNVSRFVENDAGEIIVYRPDLADELLVEIYTEAPIGCGTITIVTQLAYTDAQGMWRKAECVTDMEVAEEEQMDDMRIDDEVAGKVREHERFGDGGEHTYSDLEDNAAAKPIPIPPGPYSDLEKKYRIEG